MLDDTFCQDEDTRESYRLVITLVLALASPGDCLVVNRGTGVKIS